MRGGVLASVMPSHMTLWRVLDCRTIDCMAAKETRQKVWLVPMRRAGEKRPKHKPTIKLCRER